MLQELLAQEELVNTSTTLAPLVAGEDCGRVSLAVSSPSLLIRRFFFIFLCQMRNFPKEGSFLSGPELLRGNPVDGILPSFPQKQTR